MAGIWRFEMPADQRISERLAAFVVEHRVEDVPGVVWHEARRSLINCVGVALGGCRDEAIEKAIAALGRYSGPPAATVIGRGERVDPLLAAFLNAASANVLEFDDTHFPTVIHPAAPVAPAVLALAEERPAAGRDLIHAYLLGVEVECRIGNAVTPAHYRQGWHITATCGIFGAAAAAGKLLRLDREKMLWALGHAAAQSAGLIESLGHMAKSVSIGNAARLGLTAALLAEAGVSGPAQPLEGTFGFARVMSAEHDFAAITQGLGERWEIRAAAYKPYPCGVVLFPVLDGVLDLRERHALTPERITRVELRGHPLLRLRTDRPLPTTGRDAKVSLQHAVAAALMYGAAGVAQFDDAAVAEPAIQELRRRVFVTEDAAVPIETAFVTIVTEAGETFASHVTEARGTPARPMRDSELEAKFRDLARYGAPAVDADALLAALWALDRQPHAAPTIRQAGSG
jgi:2-methylcitrate dehydratase PrpD